MEDELLDAAEKSLIAALEVSLGRRPSSPGHAPPPRASVTLKALRSAKLALKIEPITDQDGQAVGGGNYLQLTDGATKRLEVLGRKSIESRLSRAETREMQATSKQLFKVMDVRLQFMTLATIAYTSNGSVQQQGLGAMLNVASAVRSHKLMGMPWSDEDYELVRKRLERLRRAEAIAASAMGVVAVFEAVVNDGGDPKALDVVAASALGAFPFKPIVSVEEAKSYVDGLKGNVAAQKARYEAMMRKAYGDAKYEKTQKAAIDAMFRSAEDAEDQKSIAEMNQANRARAAAPEAASGPLDRPRARGGAVVALAGAKVGAAPVPAGLVSGPVTQGLGMAKSIGDGDVVGALDGASKLFPSESTIGASLRGISALAKGDPKGALQAALGFAPVGGRVKDGLSIATDMLFAQK